MGEEVIRGSRGKSAGILAVSLLLFGLGVWQMTRDPTHYWKAIPLVLLFGCGVVVFTFQVLLPATLTLGSQTLTYKGLFGRGFSVQWDDVESFHIWQNPVARQRLPAWTYRPGCGKAGVMASVASGLGADGAVPGLWEISPEQLLERLNERLRGR